MIFVTVGMHTQGFERLVKKMDEIAANIDEEVVIQKGHTKYVPKNATHFDFATEEEIKRLCQQARVVVTHGAMLIIDALEQGTPVIAVPRLKKYGEVIDDHQLYLIQELEKQGKIMAVYDVGKLEAALRGTLPAPVIEGDKRIVTALRNYVKKL